MKKPWIILLMVCVGSSSTMFAQHFQERLQEGNQHFLAQEYYEALNAYNEVLAQDAQHAEAYLRRGLTFRKVGDSERYLQDFQKVAKLDPDMLLRYRTGRSYFPASLKEDKQTEKLYW
ncbi:MAG: hypothetical protein AAFR66_23030 [Bacteroidota bacterium]